MKQERVLILNGGQIKAKLSRMAWQLYEYLSEEREAVLIGIDGAGAAVAAQLARLLRSISSIAVTEFILKMDKNHPLGAVDFKADLEGKAVVLVDDVADSGRTLLYALRPVLAQLPSRIILAVLVDRKHKRYPVAPDIVGHSLATTLQEHILVDVEGGELTGAYLA